MTQPANRQPIIGHIDQGKNPVPPNHKELAQETVYDEMYDEMYDVMPRILFFQPASPVVSPEPKPSTAPTVANSAT